MPDHARSDDPHVQRQLDRFAQLSPGRDILGLERITALLAALGDPHLQLPPVFHVAGTNGKGSTCAFLRAMLESAGLRTHVYTSPHLVRFNERIRTAGTLINDSALAPLLAEVLDAAEARGIGPSFFEATTAAAFLAFSRAPADACVVEVGLGGRLDATNVVHPVVCGIAQIGIDHQAFLGDTIEEIAGEKAGIAKPGVPVVVIDQGNDALDEHIAETIIGRGGQACPAFQRWFYGVAHGRLQYSDRASIMTPLPGMSGDHQVRNAALAIAMIRHQDAVDLPLAAVKQGIASATWPARLQRLPDGALTQGREIWIDGAHNEAAARTLAVELAKRPMHLVLGILANKKADGIVAALAPHASSVTFVEVPGHASHDPANLADQWDGGAAPSLIAALAASSQPVLIAGSLYLCGEALRVNGTPPT
jgi:dihydrofolate synthase / folylpolyglutamate synthase